MTTASRIVIILLATMGLGLPVAVLYADEEVSTTPGDQRWREQHGRSRSTPPVSTSPRPGSTTVRPAVVLPRDPNFGPAVNGVEVGISMPTTQADDPSQLRVMAMLRNVGDKEVQVDTSLIHPVLCLEVTDAAGAKMATVPPPVPLKPEVAKWRQAKLPPRARSQYSLAMNVFSPPLKEGWYGVKVNFGGGSSPVVYFRIGNPATPAPAAAVAAWTAAGATSVSTSQPTCQPVLSPVDPTAQGIRGQAVRMVGDFMPGPGGTHGNTVPLAVPVHVFKGRVKPFEKANRSHPQLLKVIQTDKDGKYEIALSPGVYTVVMELPDGKMVLNRVDGDGFWGSVKVSPGDWANLRVEDIREATF